MNSNEFIFWLRGIIDSTEELPSKETWEKISDILKTVKLNKETPAPLDNAVMRRLSDLNYKDLPPNPYEIKFNNKKSNEK